MSLWEFYGWQLTKIYFSYQESGRAMRKSVRSGLLGLTGLLVTSTGVATAVAAGDSDSTSEVAASSVPPPIVEDYSYPGAEAIEAETGIKLIEGDGNIVKTECDADTSAIQVESIEVATSCYEVLGQNGWLSMEIPRVYAIQSGDHNVNASLTVNGTTENVELAPGEYNPVGEGQEPPDNEQATLVELRVSQ
ncbi:MULTISPECIES: hypothetical protein [unclassified Actinopolyspora]|uniref:hypothetical protein n=1 Tax=unclassified Actinopolyspora TaxID=2639451 RepID=UPI0013F5A2C5|nr:MULTISPECIES: hypothetical protein [unclassified Actinopolyspora]NHD18793.1 hypothetical protein [Actinopolyspora sp. BKK2]NHE77216.1 hypothetical protein [Actinopolyspora sp. BKK1]